MVSDSIKAEVKISTGVVVGCKKKTPKETEYYSFQGIPYALPPTGDRTFKDPVPQTPWTEKFHCKEVNACPQLDPETNQIVGDLDCLQLNVYTKKIKCDTELSSGLMPVIVYIHGGAFVRNSAKTKTYGPDYLMEKDVVLVTINYRLGAYGFLSFEDPSIGIPGNAGLKDQLLALKWVKENIKEFGGDPENVTAAGGSAGACSVHMHMLCPLSKGLFHKAVIQSGSSLNSWSLVEPRTLDLAKALGWDGKGGDQNAFKCIQSADPKAIITAQNKLVTLEDLKNFKFYPFGPSVEPYISKNCILPKSPLKLIQEDECWGLDLPVIFGVNADEGLMLKNVIDKMPNVLSTTKAFEYVLPVELKEDKTPELCKELAEKVKNYYYGKETPSKENLKIFTNLMTDRFFAHGVRRSIHHHRGSKYVYKFAVDSPTNNLHRIKYCGKEVTGTCHADEVSYIFNSSSSQRYEEGTVEQKTINLITDLLSKFAQNKSKAPQWSKLWPEWAENQEHVLHISNGGLEVIDGLFKERMKFWNELYKNASSTI